VGPEKKKRKLTTVCTICSGPSSSHLHYGAVACYSCRAFFRRGIGKSYCCVEGTGDCNIDWTCRRSCQWCRFDKCLKAGMKPELVDAAFRRKIPNRKTDCSTYDEPFLIDNFKSLEKDDISDILMDISCSGQHGMTDPINNLDSSSGFFLDQPGAQGEMFDTNYLSPSGSVSSDHSLYSDYSASSLSPHYADMAGTSYTININLTDIESQMFSLPGDFYPSDPAEPGPHLEELSLSSPILREDSEATSDNEDCDSVRNNFDIETLVDECFMSQYSGMRLSVPS